MRENYLKILPAILFIVLAAAFFPDIALAQSKWCGSGSIISVPCLFDEGQGIAGSGSFGEVVLTILEILLLIVGSLSVLFLMIGGFRYVTSYGNEENAEAAKKTMTHAIVGLVIVVMSFAVITIITNVLVEGTI